MSDVTAKLAEALRKTKELAEYWFTREDRRGYSESEYKLWHSLGFGSNTMQQAREALAAYEQAQAEPVEWQYKHITETEWKRLVPRSDQSLEEALTEIQGYRYGNRRMYEVRPLFAAPVAQVSQQAAPEPRKPLADEQIKQLDCVWLHQPDYGEFEVFQPSVIEFARAVEAAHGIKEQP